MNHIAKTLLNVMRIEVLLGIGLVLWVISVEVQAREIELRGKAYNSTVNIVCTREDRFYMHAIRFNPT